MKIISTPSREEDPHPVVSQRIQSAAVGLSMKFFKVFALIAVASALVYTIPIHLLMSTSPSSTTALSKHLWYKYWSPDSIGGANPWWFLHQQQHSSGRELLRPSGQLFFLLFWPDLYDKVILLSLTSEDAKFEVEGMKMMLLLNIAILDLKMK